MKKTETLFGKMKPGSWILIRIINYDNPMAGNSLWQTVVFDKIKGDKKKFKIFIRVDSINNEAIAEFDKLIPAKKNSIPIWLPIKTKEIMFDISGKASITGADNNPLIKLDIVKTGGPEDKIPGGNKKFLPRSYSPAAEKLIFNEKKLNNYFTSGEKIALDFHLSMKDVILDADKKSLISRDHLMDSVRDSKVIFIGEVHDSPGCHKLQLDVIRGVHRKNRKIALGFEMFYRTFFIQKGLDDFISGKLNEKKFRSKIYDTCWNPEWYALYRDIFLFAREKRVRMVGLNCPKPLIKKFRENPEGMTPMERSWFAEEIDYNDKIHRKITSFNFQGMKGFGMNIDSMYPSQCIWDDTMAESIVNYMKTNLGARMIVCAGSLHVGYRITMPERMRKRALAAGISLDYKILFPHEASWFDSSAFEDFNRLDIADYIYYTPQKEDLPGYDPEQDDSLSWIKGFKLFNEGKIEESEALLKDDDSDIAEKIISRIKIFKKAKKLASGGDYFGARRLISGLPEIYAGARKIWLGKISYAEKKGLWPE